MELRSLKAERDNTNNGLRYVNVRLTEADVVLLHGDLTKTIEIAELSGSRQNDDEKRKILLGVIDQAHKILRPS